MSVILGEWSRHVSTGSMHYASESQWQLRPQSAELVGNALSTLLVWKQIHQKNKKWNLYFFLFLIYLFQFVYTPTDFKPLVVVWNPTRYPQFGSFVLCLLKKNHPLPLWLVTRHTGRLIVFKKLSKFVGTLNTKKRVSYICLHVYRHVTAKEEGRKLCFGGIDSTLIVSPDPSSEYMEGEAISKDYLSHKFVRVTNTQAPLVKDK